MHEITSTTTAEEIAALAPSSPLVTAEARYIRETARPMLDRLKGQDAKPIPKFSRIRNPSAVVACTAANICRKCLKTGTDKNPIDAHHIDSRGSGGPDSPKNLVALCRSCHRLAEMKKISKAELRAMSMAAMDEEIDTEEQSGVEQPGSSSAS